GGERSVTCGDLPALPAAAVEGPSWIRHGGAGGRRIPGDLGGRTRGSSTEVGVVVGAARAVGGWFEPGDDIGRAWDEAEAILRACEDLDGVMAVIRDAESPVAARRALKLGFGFTGRQAALLLTLPVMAFTRSERSRMAESRRARVDLLADVTGILPAIRDDVPPAGLPADVPPAGLPADVAPA